MINQKKRTVSVWASAFVFVYALALIVVNGLFIVNFFMLKANPDATSIFQTIGLPSVQLNYLDNVPSNNEQILPIVFIALFILGIVAFILSIINVKSPFKKSGEYTYRIGNVVITFLISVLVLAASVMGYMDKAVKGVRVMKYVLYFFIPTSAAATLFGLISFFFKATKPNLTGIAQANYLKACAMFATPSYTKAKEKKSKTTSANGKVVNQVVPANGQIVQYNVTNVNDVETITTSVMLSVQEKLAKFKLLKDTGAITEAQYNAAVIRLLNSI